MAARIVAQRFAGPLAARLQIPDRDALALYWLGPAGFVMRARGLRILVDPYLSDTLGDKYRGTTTPHDRMMPVPVSVEALGAVDLALLTHHTDHVDPGTLVPLAARNPTLRFVAPKAARDEALRRTGASQDRLVLVDAGETVEPLPGVKVVALRAAHETLATDANGCHRFLGCALIVSTPRGSVVVLHSGDTIPFAGQAEEMRRLAPDLLLLLPVNGRSRGVLGNLTLEEACALAAAAGAPAMIAHHFGMCAFNTNPREAVEAKAADLDLPFRLLPASEDLEVRLEGV
jgi:L-ascorbate metabolism protein UlaG (beta-lactamase superfamily)